ncbi:MAG: N-acetyl sugar amidotransferase [Candidatus Nanopelagicales bacterium]|nr:N-acetyl sugar amidotransferase [Candidatus Nanopelagicales bacterium]MDZ4248948.1 N-acetyl sugar amidotransferase [Candidatus Nanopelagicales bacterium]
MTGRTFCTRCLYGSDHPLGITFDSEGVCSGCRVHEEKDFLDWGERWRELELLVKPYRSPSGATYDCIVPVTGAYDSYFLIHLVRERLQMNPLVVSYNTYYNTPLGIRNLAHLRDRFDVDMLTQHVNPVSVKRLTRQTLKQLGSVYWQALAGHTVFPVQTAVRMNIPLIIWGPHQGVEQVGMYSHLDNVEMSRRYRKEHDLMGHEAGDLLQSFSDLRDQDVWQFRYPEDRELHRIGVRGIYLSNFVRWDPTAQHRFMVRERGFKSARLARTFDAYDHVESYVYGGFHDWLKMCKRGYSRVLDHACREIRHKRLSRQSAIALVRKYEFVAPPHMDLLADWLGAQTSALWLVADRFRSPKSWRARDLRDWSFQGWSAELGDASVDESAWIGDEPTSSLNLDRADRFITVGRGYPY